MININDDFVQSLRDRYGDKISKLNLSNNGLKDVSKLNRFSQSLVKLTLNQNSLSNTTQFSDFPNLVELYLQENNIADITPLQALSKLEVLDLSGNSIRHISQLQVIKQLYKLSALHLKGNPICSTGAYPMDIFRLQSSLSRIDEWSREEASEIDTSLKQVLTIHDSDKAAASSSSAMTTASPQSLIQSLHMQLETMHEAFTMQEKALEANGEEAAQYAFGLSMVSTSNASKSQKFPLPPGTNYAIEKELVTKFPYYRLLQMWRRKTLSVLLHSQRLQQQMTQLYHSHREEGSRSQQQQHELECQVMKWKARTQVLEEQLKMATQEVRSLEAQMHSMEHVTTEKAQQSQYYEHLFRQLQSFLIQFQEKQQSSWAIQSLQDISLTQHVTARCQQYEAQLQRLDQQVQSLQDHLQYQQIQHRNALAVVEAERRLQQNRFAHQFAHDDGETARAVSVLADASSSSSSNAAAAKSLASLQLSVEAESLLKALFKSLDVHGNGCVSLSLWIQSLLHDEDAYHHLCRRYILQRQQRHREVEAAVDASVALSGYGQMLATALGSRPFQWFLHSLLSHHTQQQNTVMKGHEDDDDDEDDDTKASEEEGEDNEEEGERDDDEEEEDLEEAVDNDGDQFAGADLLTIADETVTWGELLLHLVIPPSVASNAVRFASPLTANEWRALSSQGIWQSYELGLLPFQLPSSPIITSHRPFASATAHVVTEEAWQQERRVLCERLQQQLRHETRLIENVKAYFEREIVHQHLQIQRLQGHVGSLQDETHILQQRWQEAEHRRHDAQVSAEDKLRRLQQENQELLLKLHRFQDTDARQYEQSLQEQQQKYIRLEKEHQILQRESSKKDVKIKSLERDILRLQTAQTTTLQDLQQVRDTHTEDILQIKQEQESQRLQFQVERQAWESEKNQLLQKIASVQEELLEVHRTSTATNHAVATTGTGTGADDTGVEETNAEGPVSSNSSRGVVGWEETQSTQPQPQQQQFPSYYSHVHPSSAMYPASMSTLAPTAGATAAAMGYPQQHLSHAYPLSVDQYSLPASHSTLGGGGDGGGGGGGSSLRVYNSHVNKLLHLMDNLFHDEPQSIHHG